MRFGASRGRMTLRDLAAEVRSGAIRECSWELFRLQHFPGRDHEEAAEMLGEWALQNGIQIDFDSRKTMAGNRTIDVIYVLFTAR
jgi:hypothetical protein